MDTRTRSELIELIYQINGGKFRTDFESLPEFPFKPQSPH